MNQNSTHKNVPTWVDIPLFNGAINKYFCEQT